MDDWADKWLLIIVYMFLHSMDIDYRENYTITAG